MAKKGTLEKITVENGIEHVEKVVGVDPKTKILYTMVSEKPDREVGVEDEELERLVFGCDNCSWSSAFIGIMRDDEEMAEWILEHQ